MEYKRSDRVAELIQREIAGMLQRGIKDPRVAGVTVTGADVSPDLRHARVYYVLHGSAEDRENASKGLSNAKGFIRREIGKRLQLRYAPEIDFRYDASLDYGDKINRLLKEIKKETNIDEE
ncbi:MAG: 30S ribosome-binding factor RbfA [Syntrophobacteraceae bacterium]